MYVFVSSGCHDYVAGAVGCYCAQVVGGGFAGGEGGVNVLGVEAGCSGGGGGRWYGRVIVGEGGVGKAFGGCVCGGGPEVGWKRGGEV